MGMLPNYKRMSEERLLRELEQYSLFYRIDLCAEEYDNGYYFKDVKTGLIVGRYDYKESFGGYVNFEHSVGAVENIHALKTSVGKVSKKYKSILARTKVGLLKLACGATIAVIAVGIVGYAVGNAIGTRNSEKIYRPQVEVDYNAASVYSLDSAPVDIVALWAINEFQAYQDRVWSGNQEQLLERLQSVTDNQYHPFLTNYYKYVDMRAFVKGEKSDDFYFGYTMENVEKFGEDIKRQATELVECFDGNARFWNSPYAYTLVLPEDLDKATSYEDLVYYVRLDVANRKFIEDDVNLNEGIPEGVYIDDGVVYISNHSIQDLNDNYKLGK